MTVEVENSSDAARAPAFTLPWRSISQGAPAWTDDAAIRVVVVTANDDFGGVQMHDIPAMDFHVTDNDTPDEVGTEVTQVCTHWAYRHELWPASLPRPEVAPAALAIPTDEMAEAFIAAANQFPACGEDEPWLGHAYRKCKAGLAAALAVQAANGQASAGTQAAPAGVDMAQIALAAAPSAEVAAPALVDDMKQELMALYNDLMKQGRGMHYWNYAAAVLNRCRGTPAANPAGAPDMVSVKKEDANNYCRILAALGMQEEGDPVAKVLNLLGAEAAPVAHPHHCTARSADGACEECELHAQEMAEWRAEQKAAAQVVLPEPDFQLKWSASAGRYAFSKPITGDVDCYTADTVRSLLSTAAGQVAHAVPAYWLDHATKTLIDPAEHAAEVEHAKSMRLSHLVNRRTPLFTAPQAPTDTFEQRMSDWAQEDSIDAERWRECLKHVYSATKGNGQPIFGLHLVPSESLYRGSLTSALQFTKDIDAAIAAQAAKQGEAA